MINTRIRRAEREKDRVKDWRLESIIAILITITIILDWLPSQIFSEGSLISSATKIIALPLIFIDFLGSPKYYLSFNYGWIYLIGLILGTGGGVLMGTIGFNTFWSLLPNVGILMYYLKPRTWEDVQLILRVATMASIAAPVWLIMVWQGIVAPDIVIESQYFHRFFAGANRSTLGLVLAFIPASLGGILLTETRRRNSVLAIGLVALVLFAPLLTAQRASNLVVWGCLGISSTSLLRRGDPKLFLKYAIVVFLLLVIVWGIWQNELAVFARPLIMRFQGYGEAQMNADYRMRMYLVFLQELISSPSTIATGYQFVYVTLGGKYHFLLGEAYTLGGIYLFAILFVGLLMASKNVIIDLWVKGNGDYRTVSVLLSLFVGFLLNQSTHAGLNVRTIYLLLGLWLSAGKIQEKQSVYCLHTSSKESI